jgi:hypothetical protein
MIVSLAALRQQPASPARSLPEFADGDPRKLQPISLEQQKKRAKELLRDLRMKKPEALARWRQFHRRTRPAVDTELHLNDAQLILARENGFGKWTDFKAHIDRARIARAAVEQGRPTALDADHRTLHIRCGNDIQHKLAIAGFVGDFLAFPDPYVQGPVPKTESLEEFLRIRVEFLATAYGVEETYEHFLQLYQSLEQARDYQRVMLWFEHDSYDQLILARLLDYFSDPAKRPARLQFISITHFPGVKIFNGLGQLPPEALRMLWEQFTDVTEPQFTLGRQAWEAITALTPEALVTLIATDTPALPTMAIALRRHLQELPATKNGLSLTEQLTLQVLAEKGAMNAARLFGWYTNHYEPLTFWGDLQYWLVLSGLAEAPRPALTLEKHGENPKDWQVDITPLGHDLLDNKADWLTLNPVQRWVGGVQVDSREPSVWRFAGDRGVILQRTALPTTR